MTENSPAKPGIKKWFLLPLGAFLLYVLSWGVVFAMYGTGRLKMPVPEWVKTFYVPVGWMQNHTVLATPLREYLFWWARTLTP